MIPEELQTRFREGAALLGLEPDAKQHARLMGFLDLMAKWNQTYNLTAITEQEQMITHHLLDSLSIWRYLQGNTRIDVGTGAGLPGVPLAIMWPEEQMYLLDSSSKRCRFLTQVKIELALENVVIKRSRVQDYHDRQFDTVICRAYGSMAEVVEELGHLLASGGKLLAMRGKVLSRELSSLPKTIKVQGVYQLEVPFLTAQRNLVVMEKAL